MKNERFRLAGAFCGPLVFLLTSACAGTVGAETLTGAGSSAAAPLYRAVATAYGSKQDFQLVYDPAGSSTGLKKIKAGEVGFGASDIAPSQTDLTKDQLVLVPTFITGVVPAINLPKLGPVSLRLTGPVLADIYLGKITRWNAPEIQSLNTDIKLPALEIKPVVRSDGSGTTFYFTDYLSRISPEWKEKFGAQSSIAWPANFTGVKGSDSVAKTVKETTGAIGYVDFNYVTEYSLGTVQLRNASGEFVSPGVATFRTALRASEWSGKGDFHATLANLQGSNVWPITMGTFVLLPKVSSKPAETANAVRFVIWAMLKGDRVIEAMSFVRLPDKMQALAYKELSSITDKDGRLIGLQAVAAISGQ